MLNLSLQSHIDNSWQGQPVCSTAYFTRLKTLGKLYFHINKKTFLSFVNILLLACLEASKHAIDTKNVFNISMPKDFKESAVYTIKPIRWETPTSLQIILVLPSLYLET